MDRVPDSTRATWAFGGVLQVIFVDNHFCFGANHSEAAFVCSGVVIHYFSESVIMLLFLPAREFQRQSNFFLFPFLVLSGGGGFVFC